MNLRVFYLTRRGISDGYRFAQASTVVCCGASIVAHFARKVRGTNIGAAKYGLKIRQGHGLERWLYSLRVRGPHFASKVSYNAGAATDDYAGQRKSPLRGR